MFSFSSPVCPLTGASSVLPTSPFSSLPGSTQPNPTSQPVQSSSQSQPTATRPSSSTASSPAQPPSKEPSQTTASANTPASCASSGLAETCEPGWTQSDQACYRMVTPTFKVNYEDARTGCTDLGATLAAIKSQCQQDTVFQLTQPTADQVAASRDHCKNLFLKLSRCGLEVPI